MNIKQLQLNLNYKHTYSRTTTIQAENITLFIEVKTIEQLYIVVYYIV